MNNNTDAAWCPNRGKRGCEDVALHGGYCDTCTLAALTVAAIRDPAAEALWRDYMRLQDAEGSP